MFMRKSLLLIAAIVISMSAGAQKINVFAPALKPVMFKALDASNAKKYSVATSKFKAPSLKEDADGNPSVYYTRPAGAYYLGLSLNKKFSLTGLFAPADQELTVNAVLEPADGDLDFDWVYAVSAKYNETTEKVDTVWSEPIEGSFVASEPDATTGSYDYSNRGELDNGSLTFQHETEFFYPAPILTVYGGDPRNPLEASYFAGGNAGISYGFGSDDIVANDILSLIYDDPEDASLVEQWNKDLHFVNYDPNLIVSFYPMGNYFATNNETANTNLAEIFGVQDLTINGFVEEFKVSKPYYLTGVRGLISAGKEYELEADELVITVIDAVTGRGVAQATVNSLTKDSWGAFFLDASIDPVLMENNFYVLVEPADGSEAPIAPYCPTTTSKENSYDDGTVYILADFTYNGSPYNSRLLDVYGLGFGDFNYIQASTLGITTTFEEPEVDGINTVASSKKADNSIYSISGVKVSNGSKKGLATGVYVQNGKKIVIK